MNDYFLQTRTERESEFNKMSYNASDREIWKVLVTQLMSSDESGDEEDQAVFIVKEVPWRSDKVTTFFEKLDGAHQAGKTEQARGGGGGCYLRIVRKSTYRLSTLSVDQRRPRSIVILPRIRGRIFERYCER